jgi:hypothetical protein
MTHLFNPNPQSIIIHSCSFIPDALIIVINNRFSIKTKPNEFDIEVNVSTKV